LQRGAIGDEFLHAHRLTMGLHGGSAFAVLPRMNQAIACLGLAALAVCQEPAKPPLPATKLPVREVTVFKDGHAYVVRDIALPADANGRIVLDELPQPVLGTFWPYASDGARLIAAKASREKVENEAAAIDLRQIARANVGKDVVVMTQNQERLDGKLLSVPSRSGDGAAGQDGDILVLQTQAGTRVLPFTQVRDLEVRGTFVGTVRSEQLKERLELRVAGGGKDARVGVMYVQKGMRWIPAYRLDLDGNGKAAVAFEATLVNDLIDLEAATVNFVVGVPKFAFEGLIDPISLQQEIAEVAAMASARGRIDFRNALSNSLMTQSAAVESGNEPEPTVGEGATNEDLFVFSVRDVTLKKGERLVLPIRTFELAYTDVYKLDIPFAPPGEVRQQWQSPQLLELARQLAAPKAMHVLRLVNSSDAPLTTAPALVLAGGRVLAQARMTYTSRGREVDVEINPAIDIRVDSVDREAGRDPGPIRRGDDDYSRIDMATAIKLWNGKAEPVQLEVTRRALGIAVGAGQGGKQEQLGLVAAWQQGEQPAWWGWWSWPYWWFEQNGFAEFRWNLTLEPGKAQQLDAQWHYFWR
jgi:hypothetical protein